MKKDLNTSNVTVNRLSSVTSMIVISYLNTSNVTVNRSEGFT